MKRYEVTHNSKLVPVVLLETTPDLQPYESALDPREVVAISSLLASGAKVEVLDTRVAEIHVDDEYVLCFFPNPTRDDAPDSRWAPEMVERELTDERRVRIEILLKEKGMGDKYTVDSSATLLPTTRWSTVKGVGR